jgi:hypothetical protein
MYCMSPNSMPEPIRIPNAMNCGDRIHVLQKALERAALRQGSDDQRGDEGAKVDTHVENGKAGVTPAVFLGIQLTHDRSRWA